MGTTGLHGKVYRSTGHTRTYGIRFARRLKEKAPREADFRDQGKNDIRLSLQTEEEKDIVFQFRLNKNTNEMTIRAYDPNVPSKATVEVKTSKPTLDGATGDVSKMRDMMNRSKSGIKESSLTKIANELLKKKENSKG